MEVFRRVYTLIDTNRIEKVVIAPMETNIAYKYHDVYTITNSNLSTDNIKTIGLDSDMWQVSITADIHKLYFKDK